MWLNYGAVNGVDFWNNSEAIKPEEAAKYGTIVHTAIAGVKSGAGRGELNVTADWTLHDKSVILKEDTRYVFHAMSNVRVIDRITTLTATDKPVTFGESKEGVLGIRVRRQLEEPGTKPEVFTDAKGNPTPVPAMNNDGVNGVYLTSEGKKGAEAWGTRARWCALSGKVDDEPVTIVDLRSPEEPESPDLLARARLRAVRGQRAGRQGVQQGGSGAQPDAAARRVDEARLPGADPERRAGRQEPEHPLHGVHQGSPVAACHV